MTRMNDPGPDVMMCCPACYSAVVRAEETLKLLRETWECWDSDCGQAPSELRARILRALEGK